MRSIRHQLTRRLVIAFISLCGAGLIVVYLAVRHELIEAIDATLQARALSVSALTEIENGATAFDFSPGFLASYQSDRPRRYFEIRDVEGGALARSPSLQNADLPWRAGGTIQRPRYYNLTLPGGKAGRAVALIFTVENGAAKERDRPVQLQIVEAVEREELNEYLGRILGAIVSCGGLLIGAIFWIVPRVLSHGLAPLRELGVQTDKIDAHSLSTRFAREELPAELQPIGQRLNDLLARLQASFERERRFSADLAHELRTPLAELRNLAECALKWPDARDPHLDRDVLAIALQMEALATRMLTLARGEHGHLAVTRAPTDIAAFIRECWQVYSARGTERGLSAVFAVDPAEVQTDVVLLRSILNNLFDNATDYAPPGTEIRVTGEMRGGYLLTVANLAPALAENDVAQFFDRFWRKETARSSRDHVGLGLSLARILAAELGWTLTVKLESGNWLVFTLAEDGVKPTRPPTSGVMMQTTGREECE